jgi:molecular chaperone HscA
MNSKSKNINNMAKVSIDISGGKLKAEDIIVGIDLGTTNSLIAYMEDGAPKTISDYGKGAVVPSVLYLTPEGQWLVGEEAKPYLLMDTPNTVYSIKRLIGKSFSEVKELQKFLGYPLKEDLQSNTANLSIQEREFTPIELSALILKELKYRAEHRLKIPISQAVITVPAYFNDEQRNATRAAGALAGLEVLRIVNEPTAAALAYGIGVHNSGTETIAVYDFGGGTFDITLLRIEEGVFEVLSTHGDTFLGGDDIDQKIIEYWLTQNTISMNTIHEHKELGQLLRITAERAKKELDNTASFELAELSSEFPIRVSLTKVELENLAQPLVNRTLQACEHALVDAGLQVSAIDKVILVGGATRLPLVKKEVASFFKLEPFDKLNPDEVVALGAAVQADILSGNRKDLLLLDVTPLSLGIETLGGVMDVLIPRNSKIPSRIARQYTTSRDGQVNFKINIFQGERELTQDNRSLGSFELRGIPAMPAGIPKLEIRFLLDADGILKVEASELRSGVHQEISIVPKKGLSDEEVEKQLMDSITYAKQDMEDRKWIELREEAKQLVVHANRFLSQHEGLFEETEMKEMKKLIEDVNQSMEQKVPSELQTKIETLNQFSQPFAEKAMDSAIKNAITGKKI